MVTPAVARRDGARFGYEGHARSGNGYRSGANGSDQTTDQLARAVGLFSLGLGLAQVLAPQKVAELIGVEHDSGNAMRLIGLREIASGVGMLTQENPTGWAWLRVGGDVMDLALLNSAASSPHADHERVTKAKAAVLGVAALDTLLGTRLMTGQGKFPADSAHMGEAQVKAAVTVRKPLAEVYSFWEGFGNLPRFMSGVASVTDLGGGRLHWSMPGPAGLTVEFDSEISEATPNERIAWRTVEGAGIAASGEVLFRPAPVDRGTEVVYHARFNPPGGPLGEKIAGLFGPGLSMKMQADLNRSKQLLELGEIVQSDDSAVPGPNPAQPSAAAPAA